MDTLPDLISESEALRRCNLPATGRWRDFLREKIPFKQVGGGNAYPSALVDSIASRIADFARATAEHDAPVDPAPVAAPPAPLRTSAPHPVRQADDRLHDRNGPSVR